MLFLLLTSEVLEVKSFSKMLLNEAKNNAFISMFSNSHHNSIVITRISSLQQKEQLEDLHTAFQFKVSTSHLF